MSIVPITDPSEGRYAQIARQMIESGDWVTPRVWIDGKLEPFLGKPPMFFWATALTMKILGCNEFAARLPNLITMLLLLALLGYVAKRYFDRTTAVNAVLICIASPLLLAATATVIIDIMLTAAVAGALLAYLAFSLEKDRRIRKRWSLLVFACLGFGFMVKGPVAVVLFGMPVFVWTVWRRKWADLRDHSWFLGGGLFLLIVLPWFIVAEIQHPGFYRYFFVNENFLRFVKHDYGDKYGRGHMRTRGIAILMFLGTTFPWCLYAIYRMWRYRARTAFRSMFRDEALCLTFLGFAVGTLFWSVSRQLLITYLFPCAPLFALWFALLLRQQQTTLGQPSWDLRKSASITLACTFAALFACLPLISHKSTKAILSKIKNPNQTGRFIFVHRTPYSAYFYSPSHIVPHPKEPAEESIARGEPGDLLIANHRYLPRISAENQERMCIIAETKSYYLFRLTQSSSEKNAAAGKQLHGLQ